MRRLLWSLLIAASPAVVAAQSADAAIDRAVAAWKPVKTARGSFEQFVTNSLTGGTATARGEFQQERPNRLMIRFTEPAGRPHRRRRHGALGLPPQQRAGTSREASRDRPRRGADRFHR
jgi:hypothetical protein